MDHVALAEKSLPGWVAAQETHCADESLLLISRRAGLPKSSMLGWMRYFQTRATSRKTGSDLGCRVLSPDSLC